MGALENLEPHEWLYLILLISLIVWQVLRWPGMGKKSAKGREGRALSPGVEAETPEEPGGTHRLSDLERILERAGTQETPGMVVDLQFTTVPGFIQMITTQNAVELYCPSLETSDTDRFREAARKVGLEARTGETEEQYLVEVRGPWPEIASKVKRIIADFSGVLEDDAVAVRIFN